MENKYPFFTANGLNYPSPDADPMWVDDPEIIWTSEQLAQATQGQWIQGNTKNIEFTGVCYYKSQVRLGDIFIARNPKQWGLSKINNISTKAILKAIEQGAKAVVLNKLPADLPSNIPVLLVSNTQKALFGLGKYARDRFIGKVICITGSVGKTTTKEMLRYLLAKVKPSVGSRANFNTISGICLSLAQTPYNMSYGVYEFGVGAPKKTLLKSQICQAHIAIITEIYEAHLSHYKTLDKLVEQKSLLFDGVTCDGTVILNHDSPFFSKFHNLAKEKAIKNIVTYGEKENSDIFLKSYLLAREGSQVEVVINNQLIQYKLPLQGLHNIKNSLAALAAIHVLGEDVELAGKHLGTFNKVKNRTEYYDVKLKEGSFAIIDDVYNANPGSIKAGLTLMSLLETNKSHRKIVVLGQMKKPGKETARLHSEISIPLIKLNIDKVFTLGTDMLHLRQALPETMLAAHGNSYEDISEALKAEIRANDIVFLKGPSPSPENTKALVKILTSLGACSRMDTVAKKS